MPLRDHFRPPVLKRASWEGFHGGWPATIVQRLVPQLEIWAHPLIVGQPLPTLPLWLTEDLCVPVELELSYEETCRVLRIAR